jgi:GT2 family glycosyltransferase
MDLSVLIVSYNTRELTLACLSSLYAKTAGLRFEVIVVDNASEDGSADAIAERFPRVTLLRLSQNIGFARANNLAARHAIGDRLLLLNSDTVILDDALTRMVAFARAHPDAGIVGGRTLYGDGSLNATSCFGQPTVWSAVCTATGLSRLFHRSRWLNPEALGDWPRDTVRQVGVVTGCFLLIDRPLWDELGGFDERFFMYSEDTDLCLRATRLGRPCMHNPDATIVHYGGKSEKTRADKMAKVLAARSQLFAKHRGPAAVWSVVRLHDLYVLTRMCAHAVLRPVSASSQASYLTWRGAWQRRGEWHRTATPARPDSPRPSANHTPQADSETQALSR